LKPTFEKEETNQRQEQQLAALEGLLELSATDVTVTLNQATSLIAEIFSAEKVDIFFHEPTNETLVALGTSDTPMGKKQRAIGMDRLPLANGGRTVEAFLTSTPFITSHADQDPEELVGVKVGLGVKSQIATVFEVETLRRGVLLVVSSSPEFFSEQDLRFLEAIARWVGIVIHRVELIERMKRQAVEQGRRLAAEELLTIMAHDLRNYLTPLKGRIELLQRRAQREERAHDLRDVSAVNHTLGLLERVISDLLDVARLNQGIFAITARSMDLVALVEEVALAFTSSETPLHLHAPGKVILTADSDRLRQLLENVLANAVKYAPKQTAITVQNQRRRRSSSWTIRRALIGSPKLTLPLCMLNVLTHHISFLKRVIGSVGAARPFLSVPGAQARRGAVSAGRLGLGEGVVFRWHQGGRQCWKGIT
jgi:two-component system, OmpR family, sensor kinase